MILSRTVNSLKESDSFKLLSYAKQLERSGKKIIHFEIGEPDFDTDYRIKEALFESLKRGETHYAASQGILELRVEIANYEKRFRNINVNPDNIVITPGGKPILLFVLLSILNDGEEVLLPSPGYLSYSSLIRFAGGKPVYYSIKTDERNTIDPDEIRNKITRRTKAIIINYPSNPTGKVASATDLAEILEIARERKILIISDEVYSRITYEKEHISVTKMAEKEDMGLIVVVDGFSKTYAMTGWRLGWGVLPDVLVKPVVKIIQNSISCVPPFVQYAGIVALKEGEDFIKRMVAEFRKRRDAIYEMLQESERLDVYKPEGAFYFFPEIRDLKTTSVEFTKGLLEKYGVAMLPGSAFGPMGEGHIRISFANSMENLRKGTEYLLKYLKELP